MHPWLSIEVERIDVLRHAEGESQPVLPRQAGHQGAKGLLGHDKACSEEVGNGFVACLHCRACTRSVAANRTI